MALKEDIKEANERAVTAAAEEIHEYVKALVKPWTDFRGHQVPIAEIIRKHLSVSS